MTIKHIYWFAHYNIESPSTRYRGKYLLEELHNHGVSHSFVYPGYSPANIVKFIWIFLSALLFRKKDSLIVFQKIHTDGVYAKALKFLLKYQAKNTVYDIDDAEYLRFPRHTIDHFMENCTCVAVGSEVLKIYARRLNDNVFVLTSAITDHTQRKNVQAREEGVFTIGWVGDYGIGDPKTAHFSHKTSMTTILFPALEKLDFKARLVILGVKVGEDTIELNKYFDQLPNIELVVPQNVNWQDEEEIYGIIKTFDVGVAPLVDHEFNASKSAYKLKQYMSVGVPVLASDVGENANFMIEGADGFLCRTSNEFANRLRQVYSLPREKYGEMSANALSNRSRYSLQTVAKDLLAHFADDKVLHDKVPVRQKSNVKAPVTVD